MFFLSQLELELVNILPYRLLALIKLLLLDQLRIAIHLLLLMLVEHLSLPRLIHLSILRLDLAEPDIP